MNWFEALFGFEETQDNIDKFIVYDPVFDSITSTKNDTTWDIGRFVTIGADRITVQPPVSSNSLKLSNIIGDVRDMHFDVSNSDAVFQVASQTNCLEMVNDTVKPSDGITRYMQDMTQGPACATACAAGTLYRNYFEQNDTNQIDLFDELFEYIFIHNRPFSKNGYVKLHSSQLKFANYVIESLDDNEYLTSMVKVGIHPDIEVNTQTHYVSQVYCSAIPIFDKDVESYERLARIVLESAYESTLKFAVANMQQGKSNKVFLTLLGGGAFKNPRKWIFDSMKAALMQFKDYDLDVKIVSRYGVNNDLLDFVNDFNGELAELV